MIEQTFEHYIQPLLQYFHTHPHMGEFFAFLIAFAESLPLIGTIIPGSVTMTAIGTLVGAGILPGFTTFAWACVGAFCGDSVGYFLGYVYTDKVSRVWPFSRYPHWLEKGEAFFDKHGGKSILIGRFVGPARSTVPMVAGILKLPLLRFALAAIPSAILWAIAYMVPGIILGALALELPPKKTTEFIIIGLVCIVLLWFVFWLIQYFFKTLVRLINAYTDKLWNWLYRHHSSQFFIKLITNRSKPNDHHQLTLTVVVILSFLLFLIVFSNVIMQTRMTALNAPLFHLLQSIHTQHLDTFFLLFTVPFTPKCIAALAIIITACLIFTKQWRAAFHLFAATGAAGVLGLGFKHIYYSPRPQGFMQVASSSSFPSGHTLMCFVIVGFLSFLTAQIIHKKWHWIPYTLATIIILFTGLSRLYLGAHWLTDIIGAYLLGTSILLTIIISYRRLPKPRSHFQLSLPVWLCIVVLTFLIPGGIYTYHTWDKNVFRYTPYSTSYRIRIKQWWNNPQDYLPLFRNSRFGKPVQPFNLQIAAPLEPIAKALKKSGWKIMIKRNDIKYTLQRLTMHEAKFHMPIFPLQYLNRRPVLMMIKAIPNSGSVLELRLWKTNVHFIDTKTPLWIGALSIQNPKKNLLSLHHLIIVPVANVAIEKLANQLGSFEKKIMTIPTSRRINLKGHTWDGKVLMVKVVDTKPVSNAAN